MADNLKVLHISHPTDRPNFTYVSLGDAAFYLSYNTVVAFAVGPGGWAVSENIWSQTTGKHLNHIEPDKGRRLPYARFAELLADFEERLTVDYRPGA